MGLVSLGDFIKESYEDRTRIYLPKRTYVVIRLDGKGFSRYTSKLEKPFDQGLIEDFDVAIQRICPHIMGCKVVFTQSDEVSVVITDFDTPTSEMWFGGNLQKIASVSASLLTAEFNKLRIKRYGLDVNQAYFDARVFTISDYLNLKRYLLWRQLDCRRNAISSIARSKFSHRQLENKSTNDMIEMLKSESVEISSFNPSIMMGRLCSREKYLIPIDEEKGITKPVTRHRWSITPAPDFKTDVDLGMPSKDYVALPNLGE